MGFIAAAVAVLVGLIPLGWVIHKLTPIDGLVALELASVIMCGVLLLLCEGFSQPSFSDLALAFAIMSFGGGLVYARFLERWV